MLCELCKRTQHVTTCFIVTRTKEMLAYVGKEVRLVSNRTQHMPTSCNIAQHGVQTNATCCANMLRSFAQALNFSRPGFINFPPLVPVINNDSSLLALADGLARTPPDQSWLRVSALSRSATLPSLWRVLFAWRCCLFISFLQVIFIYTYTRSKSPCKRTQHVGTTSPNIVGIVLANVGLRVFKRSQHVGQCCFYGNTEGGGGSRFGISSCLNGR